MPKPSSERFREDIYCLDCVEDGIEGLWESVSNGITKRWLTTLDIPIAVDIAMLKIKKVVAWSVASHDGNIETIGTSSDHFEKRDLEREPTPTTIDPWARGTIPTKKEVIDPFLSMLGSNSATPSVASRTPSRRPSYSGSVGSSRSYGSKTGGNSKATGGRKEKDNIPGTIIELDEEGGPMDWESTGGLYNELQKAQRKKLREMNARQKTDGVDEFALMKLEIDKAEKSLKGKNKNVKFVVDKDGKLIPVDPVRPEGLPPFTVNLSTSIGSGDDEEPEGRKKGKGKKTVRVVGSPSVTMEDMYFKAANTLASTLAGGEQIKEINPGVSIQAGDTVRMGPESIVPPNKQTRKEYLRGGGGGGAGGSYLDASYLDSPGAGSGSVSPGGPGGVQFAIVSELFGSPGLGDVDSRVPSPNIMSAPGTSSMRLPDIDIFEGSRRVVPPEPMVYNGTEEEEMGANASVSTVGGKGGKAVDQLSLVANRLPSKPTEAVQANLAKLHGGKHIAGQKDRDIPIGMISPSARTHLPAPGYGYTTGHGLIGANDRSVNGGGQLNSASFTSNSAIPTTSSTSKISTGGGKKSDSDGGVIIKERPDIARQILR